MRDKAPTEGKQVDHAPLASDAGAKKMPESGGTDDTVKRNEAQVQAALRRFVPDAGRAGRTHGVLSSREAEQLLAPFPVGTWVLRDDESRRGHIVSVKEGDGVYGHHFVDAATVDSPALRKRFGAHRLLPPSLIARP